MNHHDTPGAATLAVYAPPKPTMRRPPGSCGETRPEAATRKAARAKRRGRR